MAIQATDQIKVGDHVRLRSDERYLGKVVEIVRFVVVQNNDDDGNYWTVEDALEVAPRLTPDEAWAELPYAILAQIKQRMAWGALRLHDYDQKQIRTACYRLLGGAGIKIEKVDGPIKQRVRKAIERIANAMGIEVA